MDGRRWSDLPADVLREISCRVCALAGFVYFHAVCKPWRASRDPLSRGTTTIQCLPWLVVPVEKDSANLEFRCVFSKASYHATLTELPVPTGRNWVCSTDGAAIWYLTVEDLRPSLHNPLTGEVTRHLPLFHEDWWKLQENPRGIVYNDGTIFLYRIYFFTGVVDCKFRAALLRPGDAEWTVVERTLVAPEYRAFCAAYHRGRIMFTVDGSHWIGITEDVDGGDMLVPKPCPSWWDRSYYTHRYSYVLESRGELLWVLVRVLVIHSCLYPRGTRISREISLVVRALEVDCSVPEKKKTRWVRKEGRTLADRVLFLGWPNSFTVDASRVRGHGACAYFVYYDSKALLREQVGVFRYDLITDKAEFVERLPQGWENERCTWHVPQPAIAPIKELTERTLKSGELNQQGPPQTNPITIPARVIRHYEPCFRILVRDLTLTATSAQLRLFFGKHGKVFNAEVLYYKKTKRSQGIGILTMSTLHAHQQDALDALNALFFDGCHLKISFVKKGH